MARRKGYYRFLLESEGVKRIVPSYDGFYVFNRRDGVMGIRGVKSKRSKYKVNRKVIDKFKKEGRITKTVLRNLVNYYSNFSSGSDVMAFRRFIDNLMEETKGLRINISLDELENFLLEHYRFYSPHLWRGIYDFAREKEYQKDAVSQMIKRFVNFVKGLKSS